MNTFSEERSAEVVAASFANTTDDRLREAMGALVQHLHAVVPAIDDPVRAAEAGPADPFRSLTFDIVVQR